MLNTAPNTYMNKGLIPNASKNRLHFLYPLMSMIQMSKANELAANPACGENKCRRPYFFADRTTVFEK